MIPTYVSDNTIGIPVLGNTMAVRGHRPQCGKTTVACMLAHNLSESGSVQIIVDPDVYNLAMKMYTFIADQLAIDAPPYNFFTEPQDDYKYTIYDVRALVPVEQVFYIAPPLMEDVELGILDEVGRNFRTDVSINIGIELSGTTLTFLDSGDLHNTINSQWLNSTDWLAIRELERMFLKDTDLGKLRNFLRKAAISEQTDVGIKL